MSTIARANPLVARIRQAGTIAPRQTPAVALVILLVAASFPMRFNLPETALTASAFDAVLVAVFALYLLMFAVRGAVPLGRPYGVAGLAVGLAAIGFLSLLWSNDPEDTLLLGISSVEGLLVFLFVLAATVKNSSAATIRYMIVFVVLLVIPPILLLLEVPGFAPPSELDPTSGDYISYYARLSHPFIGRSNNLGTLLAFFVLPLTYWALKYRHKAAGAAACVAFVAVILTFSRGVLIGLAVGFVGLALTTPAVGAQAAKRGIVVLALALAAGFLFFQLNSTTNQFLSFSERLTAQGSVQDRLDSLEVARQTFASEWWHGSGGNAGQIVHNVFLQQFVDFGLFLGAAVALLFVTTARSFFRGTECGRVIGWAFVSLLVSCIVESSFEGTLLRPLLFLCIGLGVALAAAQEREAGGSSVRGTSAEPRKSRSRRSATQVASES